MITWIKTTYHNANPKYRAYLPVVPIFVLVLMLVSVYRLYQEPVTFSSTARVVVSGRMNLPESAQGYMDELSNFLGTQVEMISSEQIAKQAREQLAIEHPELTGNASVNARLLRGTTIIVVESVGSSAEYTQQFLDEVIRQYMEVRSDNRREISLTAMKQIRDEIDHLEPQIAAKEEELFKLKQRNNMGYLERQSADAAQLLSELKMRQASLKMQLQLTSSMKGHALATSHALHITSLDGYDAAVKRNAEAPVTAGSAQVAQLKEQLIKLQVDRESLLTYLKPKHPKVRKVDEEIRKDSRLIELLSQEGEKAFDMSEEAIRSELATVNQAVAEWEQKTLEASRTQAEYEKIQGSLARTRDLYTRLLNSLQNINISKDVNVDIIRVMEPASLARPTRRSTQDAITRGGMLGFMVGVVCLLILVRIDTRAFSASEIAEATKMHAWIEIPDVTEAEAEFDPLSVPMPPKIKEAMRRLTAALFMDINETRKHHKVIFCVSSTPGEGKSTIAQNLALQAAESGLNTLLVDADLRRGKMGAKFGLDNNVDGLSEAINEPDRDWKSLLCRIEGKSLSVLPRGTPNENTLDYLVSWLGQGNISKFKEPFDVVIIDSAPLVPVSDSVRFLAEVDEVVLVTRLKATHTNLVDKIATQIRKVSRNEFKLVVNSVNDPHNHYEYV